MIQGHFNLGCCPASSFYRFTDFIEEIDQFVLPKRWIGCAHNQPCKYRPDTGKGMRARYRAAGL
jgi:hypothetical protein